jgi:hypothetical protein
MRRAPPRLDEHAPFRSSKALALDERRLNANIPGTRPRPPSPPRPTDAG